MFPATSRIRTLGCGLALACALASSGCASGAESPCAENCGSGNTGGGNAGTGGGTGTGGSTGTGASGDYDGSPGSGGASGGSTGTGGDAIISDGSRPFQGRVVGYATTWGGLGLWDLAQRLDFLKLTHLNIAFANPKDGATAPDLSPNSDADIATLVGKAHAAGVRVMISIGGINDSERLMGLFGSAFADAVDQYLDAHGFDGVDVDIEGNVVPNNIGKYTEFVQAMSAKLKPKGKEVTAALATWFETSGIPYGQLDFVNVMAYDHCDFNSPCEHATMGAAQEDLDAFSNQGVPHDKLVLGVPFYGYCWGSCPQVPTLPSIGFADILKSYPDAWNQDWLQQGGATISYNGVATMGQKAKLAKGYGGIMIWAVAQDASGDHSLLKAVTDNLL